MSDIRSSILSAFYGLVQQNPVLAGEFLHKTGAAPGPDQTNAETGSQVGEAVGEKIGGAIGDVLGGVLGEGVGGAIGDAISEAAGGIGGYIGGQIGGIGDFIGEMAEGMPYGLPPEPFDPGPFVEREDDFRFSGYPFGEGKPEGGTAIMNGQVHVPEPPIEKVSREDMIEEMRQGLGEWGQFHSKELAELLGNALVDPEYWEYMARYMKEYARYMEMMYRMMELMGGSYPPQYMFDWYQYYYPEMRSWGWWYPMPGLNEYMERWFSEQASRLGWPPNVRGDAAEKLGETAIEVDPEKYLFWPYVWPAKPGESGTPIPRPFPRENVFR